MRKLLGIVSAVLLLGAVSFAGQIGGPCPSGTVSLTEGTITDEILICDVTGYTLSDSPIAVEWLEPGTSLLSDTLTLTNTATGFSVAFISDPPIPPDPTAIVLTEPASFIIAATSNTPGGL